VKTAKEYKKRGMGYKRGAIMMGHYNIGGGSWKVRNMAHLTTKTTQYVAKAIDATIGRCLLKARAMVNVPPLGN